MQIELYKRFTGTNFLLWGEGNLRAMTKRLKSQFPRSDVQCQIPKTLPGSHVAELFPGLSS